MNKQSAILYTLPFTPDISNLYSRHNILNFELQRPEFGVTQEKLLCSNTIMVIQQHEYNHQFLSENRSFISSTENVKYT